MSAADTYIAYGLLAMSALSILGFGARVLWVHLTEPTPYLDEEWSK